MQKSERLIRILAQSVLILSLSISLFVGVARSEEAGYVGVEQCVDCHKEEVKAWQGSHHDKAMQHATDASVLADFSDHKVTHAGKENRFYRQGDEFWVTIEGPDGELKNYQIAYTFGIDPLQQYMVEFDDGRIQLIPFAWDARELKLGGQRWFHLYPDTKPSDEFYWTNSGQNWNFMCADCHSTNLTKNYDAPTDRYATTWSEINVSCEACHGPASLHIAQAKSENPIGVHYGFDRELSAAVKEWVFKEGHSTLQPQAIQPTDQLQMCAQCHSRRTQLNENQDHLKGAFLDKYRLSLITPELYYPDGQIFDEDYVYGSFLQSKMAKSGVTCTNCHDPHTAKLKIPEQQVCAQCHLASEYSAEKHTFHQANTEASQCTTCHMPETTYMEVDPRRDHSWNVPRPDLSQHIKTPNVCTDCHETQTDQWAAQQLQQWFPDSNYQSPQNVAVAFYADSIGHEGAADALAYFSQDATLSDIIRGSALQRMAGNQGKNTLVALARAVKHDSDLIRLGAIEGSSGYPFNDRWQILSPLLGDPVLSVQAEAAGALVVGWSEMSQEQKSKMAQPLEAYMQIQRFNSDRGFGRTNLANVYRDLGEFDQAIEWYQGAIAIEPYYENSYANLADLYRVQGQEQRALETLFKGITAQPKSSALPYSAGLTLLRLGKSEQASQYLKQAAERAMNNAQYWYVYGLAMERLDVLEAARGLNQAFIASGNPQHLYAQCEVLARNSNQTADELRNKVMTAYRQCRAQLSDIAPPNVIQQLDDMMN
ncbi:multiheme c-type cytochrome [Vibrio ichthyoenteri]|uniref:multiheme c-type cytochrome n=1 Tax=Vibrio ichthyoenteri TaxID=142461 RepID=UPI00067F90B0|nr:multiheme c-type cytochrome [Vibrio ichthyoenteri]